MDDDSYFLSGFSLAQFRSSGASDIDLKQGKDWITHKNAGLSLPDGASLGYPVSEIYKNLSLQKKFNVPSVFSAAVASAAVANALCFDTNGILMVCITSNNNSTSNNKSIKIYDADSGRCMFTQSTDKYFYNKFTSICIIRKKTFLVTSTQKPCDIRLWDIDSGACVKTFIGNCKYIIDVCVSPDGSRLVCLTSDDTVKVYDIESGACVCTCAGHSHKVESICISPDNSFVASGSKDGVKIWDSNSGALSCTCTVRSVKCVSVSPDSRLVVSGSMFGIIKLWNRISGDCVGTFESKKSDFTQSKSFSLIENKLNFLSNVCFTSDGLCVISARWGEIDVWDIHDGGKKSNVTAESNVIAEFPNLTFGPQIKTGSRQGLLDSVRGLCTSPEGNRVVFIIKDIVSILAFHS